MRKWQGKQKKDLDKSRIAADEQAVQNTLATINAMCNSFAVDEDRLTNITTGGIAPAEIQTDLKNAEEVGQLAFQNYIQELLIGESKDIYSPIKLFPLKTFSDVSGSVPAKEQSQNVALKVSTDLLGRMVAIGRIRSVISEDE